MTDWELVLLVIAAPTALYVSIEEWIARRRRDRVRAEWAQQTGIKLLRPRPYDWAREVD